MSTTQSSSISIRSADGTIWGGEFLLGDAAGFERAAHLRPFRLPGGEAAIKLPGRIALALLSDSVGSAAFAQDDLPPVRAYSPAERQILAHMLQSGFNKPLTTSAGRMFDGVAALIGLRQRVTFGGQAAMSLEWFVDTTVLDAYPIDLAPHTRPGEAAILDWRPLVATVLGDLRRGVDRGVIAARIGGLRVVDMLSGEQLPRICSVSELRSWRTEPSAGWHAVWRISRVEGLEPTSNTIGGTARSLHLLHP